VSRPSIESPYAAKILAALQWQGENNDCGPFTVATVINGLLGLDLKGADLAKEMNRPSWRGPWVLVRRVPNWATFPWGMVDVFKQYGLRASWRLLASADQLYPAVAGGEVLLPILGSWRPLWAHVMTMVAWEGQNGWGFANTQYDHHRIHWLDEAIFNKLWGSMLRMLIRIQAPE